MEKIFVFGSNEAGRHGAGAAKRARSAYGARYGQGTGLQGTSYAIPSKDPKLATLPLNKISRYVEDFKQFAASNPDKTFYVTKIGCGLAGYESKDIAPLFRKSTENCKFHEDWREYLGDTYEYYTKSL